MFCPVLQFSLWYMAQKLDRMKVREKTDRDFVKSGSGSAKNEKSKKS